MLAPLSFIPLSLLHFAPLFVLSTAYPTLESIIKGRETAEYAYYQGCGPDVKHFTNYSVENVQPYNDHAVLASADFCTSLQTETCGDSVTFTHTVTHGYSVDASFASAFKLSEIFMGTFTVGGSYTTSFSDAKGTGTTTNCPEGGVHCGVQVTPAMVWFSGTIWAWSTCLDKTVQTQQTHYNVTSPVLISIDGQGNQPKQTFEACYDAGTKVPKDKVIPQCPNANVVPLNPQCKECDDATHG